MTTDISARLQLNGAANAPPAPGSRLNVLDRLSLLALLGVSEIALEVLWKGVGPGGSSLVESPVITGGWTVPAFRFVVFFLFTYAAFAMVRSRRVVAVWSSIVAGSPISTKLLAGHFIAVLTFLLVPGAFAVLGWQPAQPLVTFLRIIAIVFALVFGAAALLPLRFWSAITKAAGGEAWVYGAVVGALVNPLASALWALSSPLADLTFWGVFFLLKPFWPMLESDVANRTIAVGDFAIVVDPSCSGIEGMVLMLVLGSCWLLVFRKEYRFPHALALLPLAISLLWVLNSARIAALLSIGASGSPGVAITGFHSQAGWMAFVAVSLGIWLGLGRLRSVSASPVELEIPRPATQEINWTAVYLAPLLALVAASMLSRAASAGFEWLYPVRLIAVAAVLWIYRAYYQYRKFSLEWSAPLTGFAVFGLWLTIDWLHGIPPGFQMPTDLASLPPLARAMWITGRVITACLAVPIAEELAFRGFLARRLMASIFEKVSYQRLSIPAILVSSLAFGLVHGGRWDSGLLAGLAYAVLVRHTGRLGDAIIAHATTNLLIAVSVLSFGRWELW